MSDPISPATHEGAPQSASAHTKQRLAAPVKQRRAAPAKQRTTITALSARSSSRSAGLGRVLVAVYLILALAATFRSFFQIMRKFDEAPVAYLLSALAGLVYIVATIALTRKSTAWRRVAWIALTFELAGVLIVGTLSLLAPQWFAHPSVWSWFGMGYLFIPLGLPILGMVWLSRTAPGSASFGEGATPRPASTTPDLSAGSFPAETSPAKTSLAETSPAKTSPAKTPPTKVGEQ